jgi:hypothetical protein
MSDTAIATTSQNPPSEIAGIEKILTTGDLASIDETTRVKFYLAVCQSVGLNPLTKPFEYLTLDGRMVLYANKGCAEQLRVTRNVSVKIIERRDEEGTYTVTAQATLPDGRTDEATGTVAIEKEEGEWLTSSGGKRYFKGTGEFKRLRGDALANAKMKAETKAKRRVTLSICGLGMLDESELDTIPAFQAKQASPAKQIAASSVGADHTMKLIKALDELDLNWKNPKLKDRISKVIDRTLLLDAPITDLNAEEVEKVLTAIQSAPK